MFPSQRIISAQPLKGSGVGFQGIAVASRVVERQRRVGGSVVGRFRIIAERGRHGWSLHVKQTINTEEAGHGFERHTGAIGLSVGRIAGDVGRGEESPVEEFARDVGLVLPRVDNGFAEDAATKGAEQGTGVDHLTATGIYHDGAALQAAEEIGRGEVVGGVKPLAREWRMEGDDVGLPANVVERGATGGIGNAASSPEGAGGRKARG